MSGGYLRRYTELPSLIYLLTEKKLTLLDPQSWDDRNDSHYLTLYRRKLNLKSVLALCFTTDDETYHHWSVFARGSGGVRIEFKRNEFVAALKAHPDIRVGKVKYLKLDERRRKPAPKVKELPFLKRYAFRHETEFRAIYASKTEDRKSLDVPIDPAHIARITLCPWIHPVLSDHAANVEGTVLRSDPFYFGHLCTGSGAQYP